MSEPRTIGDIMLTIASDPADEFGAILRKCPFIQKELIARGIISLDDLTDEECDRLIEEDVTEELHKILKGHGRNH